MSVLSLSTRKDRFDATSDRDGLFVMHDDDQAVEPSRQAYRAMELLRHWNDLPIADSAPASIGKARPLPHLRNIDPIILWPWLGDLSIADHIRDRRDLRFALIGTNTVEQFGANYTGRLYSELVSHFGNADTFDEYWKVIDSGEPAYDFDRFLTCNERYAGYHVHRVILPYGDDKGEVARLVIYYGIDRSVCPRA